MQLSRIRAVQRTISRHSNAQTSPAGYIPSDRKRMEGGGEDFRPPWVYVGTRLISFVVIPAVGLYSVFLYDFGKENHVFMPIRKWTADALGSFFTLSSAERTLLQQESQEVKEGTPNP